MRPGGKAEEIEVVSQFEIAFDLPLPMKDGEREWSRLSNRDTPGSGRA
jgi:hypothetical protein